MTIIDNHVPLHVHSEDSNFRLLDSINKLKPMVLHVANDLKQTGMAVTEHESVSSHVKYLRIVNELKKDGKIPQDFKPILGNEIYLVDGEYAEEQMSNNKPMPFYHFLLLAKDATGHEQLRKLSARAWYRSRTFRGMERTPTYYSDFAEIVAENPGHLIGSTACLGSRFAKLVLQLIELRKYKELGEIPQSLFSGGSTPWGEELMIPLDGDEFDKLIDYKREEINEFIWWGIETFGKDDFYIEIQPSLMDDQIEYNKMAVGIADAYELKYIVTTDAHYMRKEDRQVHEAFLTSEKDGESNREVGDFYSSTHFYSTRDLCWDMAYLGEEVVMKAINNTKEIADKCEFYDLQHKQEIPLVPLPDEDRWYKEARLHQRMLEYPNIKAMIESDEIYDRRLISLIAKGFKDRKIPGYKVEAKLERVNTECGELIGISVNKQVPISSYFVTMKKMIDIIWEEAESIVGVSRGSGAGYEINYLLGITQISPLEQGVDMPHWRFISAERPDYPKQYWGLRVNPAKGCVA